jgi:hypothetical protein
MIADEFSSLTLDLLRRAGWRPDRRVATDGYRSRLAEAGYAVSPAVLEFLQSFGGLSITRPTPLGDDILSFDPADALTRISRARVGTYEKFLDATLCVIGSYFTQTFTVMMDPNGKVYGGADDTLRHLGDSGEEAVENLLTRHKSTLLQGG